MKEIDYGAIRRRIILRWLIRLLFVVNLVLFLGNSLAPRVVQDPQLDFIRLVWFVIVVIHGAYALYDLWPFRLVSDLLHRQMDREAERLRAQGYTVIAPAGRLEKPKRAARLADDGEIEYEDETLDPDEAHAAQRRAQN